MPYVLAEANSSVVAEMVESGLAVSWHSDTRFALSSHILSSGCQRCDIVLLQSIIHKGVLLDGQKLQRLEIQKNDTAAC